MWDELGIAPSADPKAIRRAYAARLKKLDPDRDPGAFTRLREALEWALAEAEDAVDFSSCRDRQPETDVAQDGAVDSAEPNPAFSASDAPPHDERSASGASAAQDGAQDGADAQPDWLDITSGDHALLEALETALSDADAAEAIKLYCRAAATGAVPLQSAPALLERLFAVAVDDPGLEGEALRELAHQFGWDRPVLPSDEASDLRERVLSRLAAESWYASLFAMAERRNGATRKQAKLARLMLGRIGRFRLPRVDRAALKTQLDAYRTHEAWMRDRFDPRWIGLLERRWRRREIVVQTAFALVVGAMLINGVYVFVRDALEGTLAVWWYVFMPLLLGFVLWALKQLAGELRCLLRARFGRSGAGPPDDPEARLRWLERQAELAYQAIYDAPLGSPHAARYSDAKAFLADAIALAHRLGHAETADRLTQRLAEIKAVYRAQFPV